MNIVGLRGKRTAGLLALVTALVLALTGTLGASAALAATINGTTGNDTLIGTAGADTAFGFAGNDTLDGRQGNDRLYAGNGRDTVVGGNGDDVLAGDNGNDRLTAGLGSDRAYGGANNDYIDAGRLADPGRDYVFCGPGEDEAIINLGDIVDGETINSPDDLEDLLTSCEKITIRELGLTVPLS